MAIELLVHHGRTVAVLHDGRGRVVLKVSRHDCEGLS